MTDQDLSGAPTLLPSAAAERDPNTIPLDYPLRRGAQVIDQVTLRKPSMRTLAGISIIQLRMGDAEAIGKLLPRISEPPLTRPEVEALDPADLGQLSETIGGFFLTRAQLAEARSL